MAVIRFVLRKAITLCVAAKRNLKCQKKTQINVKNVRALNFLYDLYFEFNNHTIQWSRMEFLYIFTKEIIIR